jgi:hypothetical protein
MIQKQGKWMNALQIKTIFTMTINKKNLFLVAKNTILTCSSSFTLGPNFSSKYTSKEKILMDIIS